MKNKIVRANINDGIKMLDLMESSSAKGSIELIYTRRPNAFLSYTKEGDDLKIGLIKDDEENILLQIASVVRDYYINGEKTKVGYVTGIRKRNDYKGCFNWKSISDFVREMECDMFYCSFLSDNNDAMDMFKKKRKYIPELHPVSEYTTYIINPKAVKKVKDTKYTFRPINESDFEAVSDFLNKEGCKYNFSPAAENLFEQFHGLNISDCYILENCGTILAFGALWNQKDYKQHIVTRYSGYMKFFKKFSILFERLGYIPIPKESEILNFPTLTLFYAKDNKKELYNLFLYKIANVIKDNYNMFVIGMSSSHPNNKIYKKIRCLNFKSIIYYAINQKEIVLDENLPVHIECGLL